MTETIAIDGTPHPAPTWLIPAVANLLVPFAGLGEVPPAVAFLGYSGLVGAVDGVARLFFHTALALMLLMLALAPWFARPPFAISWWAFTMPSAAVILATFRYDTLTDTPFLRALAVGALLAVSALVVFVAYRTVAAAVGGRLFDPE